MKIVIGVVVAVIVLLLITPRIVGVVTDWLWYSDVGYSGVMRTMLLSRLAVFLVAGIVVGLIVFACIYAAYRTRPEFVPASSPGDPLERYREVISQRKKLAAIAPAVLVGLISGLVAQASWSTVLLYLNGESFGIKDPEFGLDIGFYAFTLPFVRMILDYLFVGVGVGFVLNLLTQYVFGGLRVGGGGRAGGLSTPARIQLAVLAGIFMLLKAVSYWFDRYDLLMSNRRSDIFYGATYTDINVMLPAKLILMAIAIICAVAFFAAIVLRDLRIPAISAVLMLLSALVIGVAWPLAMEQFSVKPSAATRERESIQRNIEATWDAYKIRPGENIDYQKNWTQEQAVPAEVNADAPTLDNIRILDPNVVSPAFYQRQALRNFYGFPTMLSVDRYQVEGQQQDFLIAARELDPQRFGENQQNWINKHTVYTHGDGIIAAPANKVDSPPSDDATSERGGFPDFYTSDTSTVDTEAYRDRPAAEVPFKVTQPRIYFGELIAQVNPDYAIVGGGGEFDGTSEDYAYTADSGVRLSNVFVRGLFAIKYGERNFLLSNAVDDDSRILYDRDPRDRVKKVAPWLTVDTKTYPAVMADGSIKWIVDGYTTLDRFPYAQRMTLDAVTTDSQQELNAGQSGRTQEDQEVSYARNSVKATVDAYTGDVVLYQFDEQDPVLKTWMKVFPGVVKPKSELEAKADLVAHLRYPEDLFKLQRELLTQYHVDNPGVFFQASNRWSVPSDPTTDENKNLAQPPYYFTASSPDEEAVPQFQLTAVLNVMNRQNLASYMTASSAPETYGRITVKELPTQKQTVGPRQAAENMRNNATVAQDRKLVEDTTTVTYGNLLALPVGRNGLLYVQPMYTEARSGDAAIPKLYRVLTYYNAAASTEDIRVGYAATVEGALRQVGIVPDSRVAEVSPEETEIDEGPDGAEAAEGSAEPGPATPGAVTPEVRAVMDEVAAAFEDLQKAQESGSYEDQGKALDRLNKAREEWEKLGY